MRHTLLHLSATGPDIKAKIASKDPTTQIQIQISNAGKIPEIVMKRIAWQVIPSEPTSRRERYAAVKDLGLQLAHAGNALSYTQSPQ